MPLMVQKNYKLEFKNYKDEFKCANISILTRNKLSLYHKENNMDYIEISGYKSIRNERVELRD